MSAVVCPDCGGSQWSAPVAVEAVAHIAAATREIRTLVLTSTMDGESDWRCEACGQLLLDWSRDRAEHEDGHDEFKAHHDARRDDWDELNRWWREDALLPAIANVTRGIVYREGGE